MHRLKDKTTKFHLYFQNNSVLKDVETSSFYYYENASKVHNEYDIKTGISIRKYFIFYFNFVIGLMMIRKEVLRVNHRLIRNKSIKRITLFYGIVFSAVSIHLYTVYKNLVYRPLLIAGLFTIFFFILSMIAFVGSMITGTFSDTLPKRDGRSNNRLLILAFILISTIGTAFLSFSLEWIYELNPKKEPPPSPTSYILIVDRSGSTADTDPDNLRISAANGLIQKVTTENKLPVAVYFYSNEVVNARTISLSSEPVLCPKSEGGTATKLALETVYADIDKDSWGEEPKVVLLSDGQAGDYYSNREIDSLLESYKKAGVTVSTVGLSERVRSLEYIAKKTGGAYVYAKNAEDLADVLYRAAITYGQRDLLSFRGDTFCPPLYAVLRILFLFILGVILSGLQALFSGDIYSFKDQTIKSILVGIIAGIGMEICSVFCYEDIFWYIFWPLLAMVLFLRPEKIKQLRNKKRKKRAFMVFEKTNNQIGVSAFENMRQSTLAEANTTTDSILPIVRRN